MGFPSKIPVIFFLCLFINGFSIGRIHYTADSAAVRLGPFEKQPKISNFYVNGQHPSDVLTEHSGDSW
jgi:hypothetical protein